MISYLLLLLLYGSVNPRSLLYMISINLLINLSPNVAWQAHLGGAAAGLALTVIYLMV
jgi:membrane associated rhomboid family serine protease